MSQAPSVAAKGVRLAKLTPEMDDKQIREVANRADELVVEGDEDFKYFVAVVLGVALPPRDCLPDYKGSRPCSPHIVLDDGDQIFQRRGGWSDLLWMLATLLAGCGILMLMKLNAPTWQTVAIFIAFLVFAIIMRALHIGRVVEIRWKLAVVGEGTMVLKKSVGPPQRAARKKSVEPKQK